jgi:hypothetical protein
MLHAIWSDVATDFFLLYFFSATVAHLTPTVDLRALCPSGSPRPSRHPRASNSVFNMAVVCAIVLMSHDELLFTA